MAYTAPTAAAFAARFPRFASVDDSVIGAALTEAEGWVDESWAESDFTLARMLHAAHSLTLDGHGSGAESEVAKAGAGAFKTFRSGALSLERLEPGASQFDQTSFGKRYALLLRKNKAGPRVSGFVEEAVTTCTDQRINLAFPIAGVPDDGEELYRVDLPVETINWSRERSVATFDVAATSDAVLLATVDGSTLATVTVLAGQATATFNYLMSRTQGGVLRVIAPSPADATLAGGSINIAGDR